MRIIGIGNEYRGDDGIGVWVARQLRADAPKNVEVLEMSGEGAALMEAWRDASSVIVVDVVQAGGAPGSTCRIDARCQALPSRFFNYSTHAFSLAEAVEMARALGRLPASLVVYGIEGRTYEAGAGLSVEVEAAGREVLKQVRAEMEK